MVSISTEQDQGAHGAHHVHEQSVSVSRLCCGSVSLVVKKNGDRIRIEIDRESWPSFLREMNSV